jgi:hypothetical protein
MRVEGRSDPEVVIRLAPPQRGRQMPRVWDVSRGIKDKGFRVACVG